MDEAPEAGEDNDDIEAGNNDEGSVRASQSSAVSEAALVTINVNRVLGSR
jgi:hypothetical protein